MKKFLLGIFLFLFTFISIYAQDVPKREFRGAWIQCVNGQFQGMPTDKMKSLLCYQLDQLQKDGINAVLFQVRPAADALYRSHYEPWSSFLTGRQGQVPLPYWDPLQFMIDECHKRGMELHAWINPYRVKTKTMRELVTNHLYFKEPQRFFSYDNMLFFDPGIPENRQYIGKIVKDILDNYDIDGLHMDDYFYPYPVAGLPIPDDVTYAKYNDGFSDRGDWRRNNVDLLVKELHQIIRQTKPWVKFGISPFGIYRNKKNDPGGSETNGLENYGDLYADALKWERNGWVDYLIPQLYWEIGHPAADYKTLIKWWAANCTHRPLFIGQDVVRSVSKPDLDNPNISQALAKLNLERRFAQGGCFWPASEVVNNTGNYGNILKNIYFTHPALQPQMPWIDNKPPRKVLSLKKVWTKDGLMLFWREPTALKEMDKVVKYAVYRFSKGEKVVLDGKHLIAITVNPFLALPYETGKVKYKYAVTALDRMNNESKPKKKSVKL